MLIDATYAGLISGAAESPLVIPALNRDGDCLSDLVMPMFGSIAGAESVLLAFDEDSKPTWRWPRRRTAPRRRCRARTSRTRWRCCWPAPPSCSTRRSAVTPAPSAASRAIYESVLEATAAGVRTFDLGGIASTSEFTSDVIERIRTKLEVWSSLGSTV